MPDDPQQVSVGQQEAAPQLNVGATYQGQARVWDGELSTMMAMRRWGALFVIFDPRKPEETILCIGGSHIKPQLGDVLVKLADGQFVLCWPYGMPAIPLGSPV